MAITPLTTAAPETSPQAPPAKTGLPAGDVSRDSFLKLLVAQLKNQDPLEPSDGAQFIAQLAQFSQLEQTISIKDDIRAIRDALAKPSPNPGAGSAQAIQR
jgi:flagellar basal-body rod modification protein FlgD